MRHFGDNFLELWQILELQGFPYFQTLRERRDQGDSDPLKDSKAETTIKYRTAMCSDQEGNHKSFYTH